MNLLERRRGRLGLFALLYATEGAPIGLIWWTLAARLTAAGASAEAISALLAPLALPWALKFLWAPAVDVLRGPRWTRRGWIGAAQLAMGLTLAPLLWLDLAADLGRVRVLLVLHALAAATQDVAIDGLAIAATPEPERGRVNGWMQLGMLSGRAVFGAAAVGVAARIGLRPVVAALLVLLALGIAAGALYRDRDSEELAGTVATERARIFLRHARAALARRGTWVAFFFAASGGAGFELVGGLVTPFLKDLGLGADAVSAFLLFASIPASILGALAGGALADRLGARRGTLAGGLAMTASVLLLAGAGAAGLGVGVQVALLGLVYLALGAFTAASYALFMDLSDPRLGSTQFSAYMGATNLCESWSVWEGGRLQARRGYPGAFAVMGIVSLLALGLLALARTGRERVAGGAAE